MLYTIYMYIYIRIVIDTPCMHADTSSLATSSQHPPTRAAKAAQCRGAEGRNSGVMECGSIGICRVMQGSGASGFFQGLGLRGSIV